MGRERRQRGGGQDCPRFREAISARLDSEDAGMPEEVIDAHLARCPDCARFSEVATREHRRLRVRAAGPVPDLTGQILQRLSSIPDPAPVAAAPGRGRRTAWIAATVVVMVGAGFGSGALLGDHLGAGAGPAATVGQAGASQASSRYPGAVVMTNGVPKPTVVLTDTSGQPYNLARATAGRVTLVYFGYTHCPDLCPINMALTASALRDLPATERRKITVVFISTDPARDKPHVIRAWLDRFNPNFVGLTGSAAAIHTAEIQVQMPLSYVEPEPGARVGESGQDYQVVHAAYTLIYAPDGRANLTVDDSALPSQYATTLSHVLSYGFRSSP